MATLVNRLRSRLRGSLSRILKTDNLFVVYELGDCECFICGRGRARLEHDFKLGSRSEDRVFLMHAGSEYFCPLCIDEREDVAIMDSLLKILVTPEGDSLHKTKEYATPKPSKKKKRDYRSKNELDINCFEFDTLSVIRSEICMKPNLPTSDDWSDEDMQEFWHRPIFGGICMPSNYYLNRRFLR